MIQKPNLKIEWKEEDKMRPIAKEEDKKDLSENKLEYQDNIQ